MPPAYLLVALMPPMNDESIFGPVPTKDMQTPPLSFAPSFMKDAQCAEIKDDRKIPYHIVSRLGAAGVQRGRFWRLKI